MALQQRFAGKEGEAAMFKDDGQTEYGFVNCLTKGCFRIIGQGGEPFHRTFEFSVGKPLLGCPFQSE